MFSRHDLKSGETPRHHAPSADPDDAASATVEGGLIGHFKSDHAALVEQLRQIEDRLLHGQFGEIPPRLEAFRDHLQAHLDEESEKFYAPLHVRGEHDPGASQAVAQEETRMVGIARLVLIFTKRYIGTGVGAHNRDAFARDLDVIASLLVDRIHTEESTLYPLYCPD